MVIADLFRVALGQYEAGTWGDGRLGTWDGLDWEGIYDFSQPVPDVIFHQTDQHATTHFRKLGLPGEVPLGCFVFSQPNTEPHDWDFKTPLGHPVFTLTLRNCASALIDYSDQCETFDNFTLEGYLV